MGWTSRGTLLAAVVALAGAGGGTVRAQGDASAVVRMPLDAFKKELDAGHLLVIDVRGAENYRAGHIPGALHVPLSAWTENLPKLKASKKPIVAYCA